MAKCPSPYTKKTQDLFLYLKNLEDEERVEEAKLAVEFAAMSTAEETKKKRHIPLENLPPGKVSQEYLDRCVREYGTLPKGISVEEGGVPGPDEIVEACLFEVYGVLHCYQEALIMANFRKKLPDKEIPVNRFLLSEFIHARPNLEAGPEAGFISQEEELALLKHVRPDQLEEVKTLFKTIHPQTEAEAKASTRCFLAQRESPTAAVVVDVGQGPIASLAGVIYENPPTLHRFLMIKWLVQHLLTALPKRPCDDAVMEYCLIFSPVHDSAFWLYMRWSTPDAGFERYGRMPDPCRKMTYRPSL